MYYSWELKTISEVGAPISGLYCTPPNIVQTVELYNNSCSVLTKYCIIPVVGRSLLGLASVRLLNQVYYHSAIFFAACHLAIPKIV